MKDERVLKSKYLSYYSSFFNASETIEEVAGKHAFLARQLNLHKFQKLTLYRHVKTFVLFFQSARLQLGGEGGLGGLEDFQDSLFPIRHLECSPCTGVRTETADEVIDLLGRLLPVDLTGFLKNFGGRMKYCCLCIDGKRTWCRSECTECKRRC